MMIAAGQTLQLDRARIAGVTAARTLLAAGLADVPIAPLGLGDDELLLIPRHRSAAVLRPGADGRVKPGFGRALGAELATTLARAAIDPPPGTIASAYRFTSRRHFAIWLLGSWLQGGGTGQMAAGAAVLAALPGRSALGWARRELFDDGRSLPAVFAALARQGLAAALVARLDHPDVARIAVALRHSHGLPGLDHAVADERVVDVARLGPVATATPVPVAPVEATATARAVAATAAAARTAGNDLAALPRASAALLLALLQLDGDPAVPRAALVAAAFAAMASPIPRLNAPAAFATQGRFTTPSKHHHDATAVVAPVTEKRMALAEAPPLPGLAALPAIGFASDFAGAFFLMNVFLAMGLYPDFTRPAGAGLALAPSRLLDRLAAQWFGARYIGDRLNRALAPVTADQPLPDRWAVSPEWLDAFPAPKAARTVTRHRHQTHWHGHGFPMADIRRHTLRQTPLPSKALRAPARLPAAQPARWLACLALYLDARIRRATDDPALGLSSLAIPGRCRIGADRIDIDLALADLPLPLRFAGLDRDPGWLPAEGRAIAFHFQ